HDADLEVLQQFIGPEAGGTGPGIPAGEVPGASGEMQRHAPPGGRGRSPRRPLQASNATALAQYIQWASTAVVGAASMPTSRVAGAGGGAHEAGSVPLPDLPPTVLDPTDDVGPLVW
ncbi:MAG: tellurium resistance protein, partial [Synechococcus sp.]